jgi:hypothetical protein
MERTCISERRNNKYKHNFSINTSWKAILQKLRTVEKNVKAYLREIGCESENGWICLSIMIRFDTEEDETSDSTT